MKKIFTLGVAMLLTMAAIAQNKPLDGLTLYINPGHGGFDGNDRSCWTVYYPTLWTDSAGYWESKSNFVKAEYLKQMVQEAGATIITSRKRNDSGARDIPAFVRKKCGLTKAETDVWFNEDGNDSRPRESFNLNNFLQSHPQITRQEWDSIMEGGDRYLSEIAEEANAYDVDHFLSIHSNGNTKKENYLLMLYHGQTGSPTIAGSDQMAKIAGDLQIQNQLTTWQRSTPWVAGDITFYGDDPTAPRAGLGVLRPLTVPGHLSEGSFHDYAPETHRLMNNDYCKLEALRMFQFYFKYFNRTMPQTATISGFVKSSNEKLDILELNDFYYFPNSDDQWLPINGAKVTLMQNGNELETYITDQWYNGIFAFYDLQPGTYQVKIECDKYRTDIKEITVAAEEIATIKFLTPNIRMDVEDYEEPNLDGIDVPLNEEEFEMTSSAINTSLNRRAILRMVTMGDVVYVLRDNGEITKRDALNFDQLGSALPVPTGVQMTDIAISADNFLMALSVNNGKADVYSWDIETEQPYLMFSEELTENQLQGSFAVSGPRWKALCYILGKDNITGINYNEDEDNKIQTKLTLKTERDLTNSQISVMPDGQIYVDGLTMIATAFDFDWQAQELSEMSATELNTQELQIPMIAHGASFFRYAKHIYMAMPLSENDGSKVGFVVLDITDGIDHATLVSGKTPVEGLGTTAADFMSAMVYVDGFDIYVNLFATFEGYAQFRSKSKIVANIYASEAIYNAENKSFAFRLNENATEVILAIEKDGQTIGEKNLGALSKGPHSVVAPFEQTDFDAYTIKTSAKPVVRPLRISDDTPIFQFYSIRGVAIDRTPGSPYFGRIYVTEGGGGTISERNPINPRTTDMGVYVLSSDFTDITSQGQKAWSGGLRQSDFSNDNGNYAYRLSRPTVAPDGKVFIPSSSPESSGVYVMDPEHPEQTFKAIFPSGTTYGRLTVNNKIVHNQIMHCYVQGVGEEQKLYTYDRTHQNVGEVTGNIYRYDIGQMTTEQWKKVPSKIIFNDLEEGAHIQNGSGQIYPDGNGGWWMSQMRWSSSYAVPGFVHIYKGKINYSIGDRVGMVYNGGMAVSVDGKRLAVGTEEGVFRVWDIEYDEDNVPTLTDVTTVRWSDDASDYVMGMDFDPAGNLYFCCNNGERLHVYALANTNNTYTTRVWLDPAKNYPYFDDRNCPDDPECNVEDGLRELQTNNVSVFPNPTADRLTIAGNLKSCVLYNAIGTIAMSAQCNGTTTLDLTALPAGLYILRATTAEGETTSTNIIKQ